MKTKFNTLESWGKNRQQEQVQGLKQQIDGIFEKSIKDDFDSIPVGSFKSNLPEINSISLIRPAGENGGDVLYAVIYSSGKEGRKISHNWSVLRNGSIYPKDRIPSELGKYQQEEIALEIVGLLEKINPSFIHLTDLDIIPFQDKGEPREVGSKGPPVEKPIDLDRVHFLQTIRGAEFEFANESKGFRGYTGIVFAGSKNGFIYLENQYKDNAAFIVDLPEPVDMEMIERELRQEMSKDEQDKISKKEIKHKIREIATKRYWGPISEKAKTRGELMGLGIAERVVHNDPKVWQEAIRKAIESRTK